MNPVRVVILGSKAPYPGSDDLPSVLISWGKNHILLDAGEGVQSKLLRVGVSPVVLKYVLITHLHGDHVLGLLPLMQSRSLGNARNSLTIIGPKGIKEYLIKSMQMLSFTPIYEVKYVEVDSNTTFRLDRGNIKVCAFPLNHTLPTIGYSVIINDRVKISYVTDTRALSKIPDDILGSDLLIHDSTFSHKDLDLAKTHLHSTSVEAALTALRSNAKMLILYHISPRYKDEHLLLLEARRYFPNAYIAKKFMRIIIKP